MKPLKKRILQRKLAEERSRKRLNRQMQEEQASARIAVGAETAAVSVTETSEGLPEKTEDKKAWRSTEKARRGLARVIFSRGVLIALLVLLQMLLTVVVFQALPQYAGWIQVLFRLIGAVVVIEIVNAPGTDAQKVTWMVFIMLVPIAGVAFYLYFKYDVGVRSLGKRMDSLRTETASLLRQSPLVRRDFSEICPEMSGLSSYLYKQVGFPTYRGTKTTYFPGGEYFFASLIPELRHAQKYIFLEFFIVDYGNLWDRVLEVLQEKVAQGVEVRLMYDGMCSVNKLPISYWKKLNEMGIKCKVFNQIRPVVSSVQNHRDHRKIVVIDGKAAYTGGINIADEYVNQRERFGFWKDAGIRLEGDAVRSFTVMFLQMWNVSEAETEDMSRYLRADADSRMREDDQNDRFVIPYGDSPYDHEDVGRNVYLYLLQRAKKYVHIMTPYLILDKGMRRALCQTAKCGVKVRIMMPHIPDKKYAYILGRSYYTELLSAGVQIYEYTEGFVHSKVWAVDDEYATVGSVNLDFRSLYWHFECGAFVCDRALTAEVERDFRGAFKSCRRISMVDANKRKRSEKVLGALLRVIAPIL